MSKDKKRGLFTNATIARVDARPAAAVQNAQQQKGSEQEIELDSSIIRSELFFILGILIFLAISFSALLLTNDKTNWISDFSNELLKLLIRNY